MTPVFTPATTWRAAARALEQAFTAARIGEPRADAAILVEEATGVTRTGLLTGGDAALGPAAAERLTQSASRRLAREPVFRILGRRPFWGLELTITPAVLDPRPDTESVVEAALVAMADRSGEALRLLDCGIGSGALLCALLSAWPAATGIGIDRSVAAAAVALGNAQACGLADRALVVAADWTAALAGPFDVVVSNPPYIETAAIATLEAEVRDHDPALALDGGADGLAAYRQLCPVLPALLAPGGVAIFEVGWTQAASVGAMFAAAGLVNVGTRQDLGGRDRAVIGWRR